VTWRHGYSPQRTGDDGIDEHESKSHNNSLLLATNHRDPLDLRNLREGVLVIEGRKGGTMGSSIFKTSSFTICSVSRVI
jgi:hypothetical protein